MIDLEIDYISGVYWKRNSTDIDAKQIVVIP